MLTVDPSYRCVRPFSGRGTSCISSRRKFFSGRGFFLYQVREAILLKRTALFVCAAGPVHRQASPQEPDVVRDGLHGGQNAFGGPQPFGPDQPRRGQEGCKTSAHALGLLERVHESLRQYARYLSRVLAPGRLAGCGMHSIEKCRTMFLGLGDI